MIRGTPSTSTPSAIIWSQMAFNVSMTNERDGITHAAVSESESEMV